MKVLFLTFRASLAELLLLFLGLFIAVIMYATVIYYAEMLEKANNFLNIPQAIWWAIITMTTVGYGDFYPTTVSGYFVGVLCALSGLLLLSMPIAIIASNFGTYYNGLVAREQREKRKQYLSQCWRPRRGHFDSEEWCPDVYEQLDGSSGEKIKMATFEHFSRPEKSSDKDELLRDDSCDETHDGYEGLANESVDSVPKNGSSGCDIPGDKLKFQTAELQDYQSLNDTSLKQRNVTPSTTASSALIRSSPINNYSSIQTLDTTNLKPT